MQKWIKAVIVSLTLCGYFSLSSCVSVQRSQQQVIDTKPITQHRALPEFSVIENHTNISFIIRTGKPEIWITGPAELLAKIHYEVRGQQLHLYTVKLTKAELAGMSQIEMTLSMPNVYLLNHYGSGSIQASGLTAQNLNIVSTGRGSIYLDDVHSKGLNIVNKGDGNVFINGRVNLEQVVQRGRGHIKVCCIRSPKLRVHATGPGMMSLMGAVDTVDIVLADGAFLDAKYLEMGSGYVNAQGCAVAHIRMHESQNLLTSQTGNIYFHEDPHHKAHYASGFGSMIRMTGFEP